jgi:hypothetical protein
MNLDNWVELGRLHWKEFLPKRYEALKEAGILEESLRYAAEQTYLEVSQFEEAGFQPDEAWQMVREEYLILRAEDDAAEKPSTGPSLTHQMRDAVRAGQRTMKPR